MLPMTTMLAAFRIAEYLATKNGGRYRVKRDDGFWSVIRLPALVLDDGADITAITEPPC